jgi:hypothetical protein
MAHFFTDSVENRGTSIAHQLENWGNKCLNPLASYAKGKRYVIIGKENHWDSGFPSGHDDYREKKMKGTSLRIALLVPGFFLGTVFKGLAYLSHEVRNRNETVHFHLLNRVTTVSSAYDEVTRRVFNRQSLEIRVSCCDPNKVSTLEIALQKGDWNDAIFTDQDYPYYALKLLKDGKISQMQFGTVQIFWNAQQSFGTELKIIPLFNPDRSVNVVAQNKVRSTLSRSLSMSPLVSGTLQGDLFDRDKLDNYFTAMRAQPLSEQFFFYIDQDDQPDWDINKVKFGGQKYFDSHTISQEIIYATGINALGRAQGGRMIPTLGMMQQFLNTFSNGDAVTLNPVIGLSTVKDIRSNGENDTRDMAVAFPGIQIPERADGFKAPGFDFTYHDFYHAIIASCMPKAHRHDMIKIADAVDGLRKNCWRGSYDLKLLRNRFIDMEFGYYRKDMDFYKFFNKKEEHFWYSVATTEAAHNAVEIAKWRFFANWRYNQTAYRKKIITALNPKKEDVKKGKEQYETYMDEAISAAARACLFYPTFANNLKKAVLESTKKRHPIHAYAAMANG